jgi:hypothetical protein
MNKTNVMLDLETWSTANNAVITAIGAVKFKLFDDNSGGEIIESFYHTIQPQSCVDIGLDMSVDTILWWMKQSDAARAEFQKPAVSIQDALTLFSSWLSNVNDPRNIDMWGNGSDFDNVILVNAYKACGKSLPWKYFNNRCFRTLKNLYDTIPTSVTPTGVKHNAVDDATSQAFRLIEILCHINKSTESSIFSAAPSKKKVNIKKETVRIALPPKPILDKLFTKDLPVPLKFESEYDAAAYTKAYNTPCSTQSADDNIKGMGKVREYDFIDEPEDLDLQ